MSLIRDGEVEARIAEWTAARERERQVMAEQLGSLKSSAPAPGAAAASSATDAAAAADSDPLRRAATASPEDLANSAGGESMWTETPVSYNTSPRGTLTGQPVAFSSGRFALSPPRRGSNVAAPVALRARPGDDSHATGSSAGTMQLGSPAAAPTSSDEASATASLERRMAAMERQMAAMRTALINVTDENRFLRVEVDVLRDALLDPTEAGREQATNSLSLVGRRAGTQDLKDSVCTHCLTRGPCFRCYACRSVEYCSAKCQMGNFPAHVALCRHITERGY